MTILGATLAFLFLDGPARYVVVGLLLATDVIEVVVWLRWRKRRSETGPEGLIGARGEVVEACDPEGQVKLKGQIWSARSATTIARGETVRVAAVEGVRLVVETVDGADLPPASLQRASGRSESSAARRAPSSSGRAPDF